MATGSSFAAFINDDPTNETSAAALSAYLGVEISGTAKAITKGNFLGPVLSDLSEDTTPAEARTTLGVPVVINSVASATTANVLSASATVAYVDAVSARDVAIATCDGAATPALTGERNLSVSRISAGRYQLTFDAAQADTNYSVFTDAEDTGTGNLRTASWLSKTVNGFEVRIRNESGTLVDGGFSVEVKR